MGKEHWSNLSLPSQPIHPRVHSGCAPSCLARTACGSELSITTRTSQGQVTTVLDSPDACEWLREIMKLLRLGGNVDRNRRVSSASQHSNQGSKRLESCVLRLSALLFQAAPISQCIHWNAVCCIHFLCIHNTSVCPGYTQPSSNFKHQAVCTMWVGWVWTWPGQGHAPMHI